MCEAKQRRLARQNQLVVIDAFGGRVHVEWSPNAAITPLGQPPFFTQFLQVSSLFDAWIKDCPLVYQSNNASGKREALTTLLTSGRFIRALTLLN